MIDRKLPIHKGEQIYNDDQPMQVLYAICSGTFKTYTINKHGEEQITGFHLTDNLLGFNAIANAEH
jgi:CRP/FNR family transcriptional regulator